jgi:hypothetical protein
MTPPDVLKSQISALEKSLDRAGDSLEKQGTAINTKLLQSVKGRFKNDLEGLRNRCQSLRKRIDGGASPESGWTHLANLQQDSTDLLQECLAFLEGALVRSNRFDGGICALADSMLLRLSQTADLGWRRFTLAAVGEVYSTMSGIVRLRFTDTDIWSLPVAVHEFGHFAAGAPTFSEFAQIAADAKNQDARYESHLRELFSDLFATYALGPSLVLACVLLRFSPVNAYAESKTHPSNAQRVWWMLETLAAMDESDGGEPILGPLAGKIRAGWTEALKASGQAEALPDAEVARLRPWLLDLYDLVNSRVPVVRYRSLSFLRAQQIQQALRNSQTPLLRDEDEIPDVLNAAWLYRLQAPSLNTYEFDGIAEKAFVMCEQIANRQC